MALTRISSDQIEPGSITAELLAPGAGAGPVIANVQIANSSYVALDDTAVALDGGYIILNGSNFGSNTQVIIGNSIATSVTYVSATEIRAQVPAKTAGSYIVYLVNTDTGATAIRVNAVTYSGTPTWSTGSILTEGAVDEAISIQLDATSDTSVTYQLQTGSTLPAGLTLAANGLLSGTVTGLNQDTLYNFTIEAIDAENQDSPRAFSITITAGDQNINSVVLALNADSNTFITDASTNSFAITPNGDTRPSAFSPYNTSWSNFFDGTGDYLNMPGNAAFAFGTGDFTIECWAYRTVNDAGSYQAIITNWSTGWWFGHLGGIFRFLQGGGTLVAADTVTSPLNTWNHYAVSRQGTTLRLFVDGVVKATVTNSTDFSATNAIYVGITDGSNHPFTGYLTNLRVVKGTAVYTSAFSPPTSPLTAISGTSLLTCQSNRFIDNSTNNFTITRNGDTRVSPLSPFAETDATTGSGYFDGSGDFLTTASNAAFAFGTGDFTVEGWAYLTTNQSFGPLFISSTTGAGDSLHVQINSANKVRITNASTEFLLATDSIPLNTWTHIAVVRTGTSLTIYQNGIANGSITNSTNFIQSGAVIGYEMVGGNYYFTGYFSNVRIVKGTAVYTSAFTPPTSPLTAISGTSLLTLQNRISYNNSQPVDESGVKNIITRNGNASVGSYTPHTPAGWSAYFDGTGDYLQIADDNNLDLSGDFTIDLWFYWVKRTGATFPRLLAKGDYQAAASAWRIDLVEADGYCGFAYGSTDVSTSFGTQTPNQWTHLAVTRSGSTLRTFRNGVLQSTRNSVTQDFTSTYVLRIGAANALNVNELFSGYISNVRIVKGTALYTSNFTPSTTPLEPVANTSLLTLRGPGFTDDGPNRFAITRNGDTRITPFSPFKTHTIVPDSHSVYFDGTGDYLSATTNEAFGYGTGDFTIEFWLYLNSTALQTVFSNLTSVPSTNPHLYVNGSIRYYTLGGDQIVGSSLVAGQWYHIALCRASGSTRLFINGTQSGSTYNDTNNYGTSAPLGIGTYWSSGSLVTTSTIIGYMSNLRVVKGTAVYTSAFTPPTSPLTNIANTSLLTCQSSTVIDNSNNAFAITVNGNAQPSKYNPFGETITEGVQYSPASHGGSYYFDGTGDRIDTPSSLDNSLGTSNFTLEFWFNPAGFTQPTNQRLVGNVLGTSWGSNGWTIGVSSNNIFVQIYNFTTTNSTISTSTNILLPQWYHIALTRNGSTFTLFVNGVSVGTYSSSGSIDGGIARAISVGGNGLSNEHIAGYISGVRLVKGTALYTSAFVPPAAPPSPVAGTTLLLNGTNAAIADGVGKNVLETVGTAKLSNDTKKYGTGSIHIPAVTAGFKTAGVDLPGDFTIEFWVLSPISGGENFLIVQGINATNGFLINATQNAIRWRSNGTTDTQYVFPTNNTNWYHVAIVRSGSASNNVKVYYNGNSVVSGTYTNQILASAGSLHIGPSNLLSAPFMGYGHIDDLRISKGVARYTSNFTPPTSSFKLK